MTILTQNRWYIVAPQIWVGYNYLTCFVRMPKVIAAPQNWVGYIPLQVVRTGCNKSSVVKRSSRGTCVVFASEIGYPLTYTTIPVNPQNRQRTCRFCLFSLPVFLFKKIFSACLLPCLKNLFSLPVFLFEKSFQPACCLLGKCVLASPCGSQKRRLVCFANLFVRFTHKC